MLPVFPLSLNILLTFHWNKKNSSLTRCWTLFVVILIPKGCPITYKKNKINKIENEQVMTISNSSVFHWPSCMYVLHCNLIKLFAFFQK